MGQINQESVEVLIIGAGPSGSVSAALLKKGGIDALVLEKQLFPRFSIGESLLPQLMVFLEKAEMLDTVLEGNFQFKNGAAFGKQGRYLDFNFENKSSAGPGTTFQVKRADFDKRLADQAESQGVPIRYQHEVIAITESTDHCLVLVQDNEGIQYEIKAGFVLDASGFGRVLPKLLDLEYPSDFPVRKSLFCHIKDNITDPTYDRDKVLISVHPIDTSTWYWLIPFSDGTCSFGVVGTLDFFKALTGSAEEMLNACKLAEPGLAALLPNAEIITEVQEITGYSVNVKSLYGNNYALLGNAGEFLDPIFSSGVTIALKSADLAASLLIRKKQNESVCWENDYEQPLMKGVNTFRAFVNAWYDGSLQDIIFYPTSRNDIKEKICSILAGYAWDDDNPFVKKTKRRLGALAEICKN